MEALANTCITTAFRGILTVLEFAARIKLIKQANVEPFARAAIESVTWVIIKVTFFTLRLTLKVLLGIAECVDPEYAARSAAAIVKLLGGDMEFEWDMIDIICKLTGCLYFHDR